MNEQNPSVGRLSELILEASENSAEPDDRASIRAERGSPTPSCGTIDASQGSLHPQIFISSEIDSAIVTSNPVSTESEQIPVESSDFEPNPELLERLLELGFDDLSSVIALKRTKNAGLEQAIDWIVERSNESDLEEEESSSESETEDMGGVLTSLSEGPVLQDAIKAAQEIQKNRRTHKMVLVANMGLKMGAGKLAAQVGHATLAVYRLADSSELGKAGLDSWFRHGQVKIVVKGKDTEELMDLFKTAKDTGLFAYIVQDAGYTQIPQGSRTVLGVFGEKEKVDAVTGHLRLL